MLMKSQPSTHRTLNAFNDAASQSGGDLQQGVDSRQGGDLRPFRMPKPEGYPTVDELRQNLHNRLQEVLYHLFPAGKVVRNTFMVGDVQGHEGDSLTVELSGNKVGLWYDFATGEGGDIFSLWGAVHGWDHRCQFPEIVRSIQEWLGTPPHPLPKSSMKRERETEDLGAPTGKWDYQDINGHLIARIYRYDTPKGKQFHPWDVKTQKHKAPDPRPLYNQPGIACSGSVIVVEGEKCADALINLGICATTAMNGANAPVDKTDWSPLYGKHIVIWPDQDAPGKGYADKVIKKLRALDLASLALLVIPEDKPEKWDAADAVAEGMDIPTFLQACIQVTIPLSEGDITSGSTGWPDPLPVRSELLPVKSFDLNLMPDPLRDFVKDCSFRMQCPPDYIAVSMVFMFGGLIGAACGIKPKKFDDWLVIPNLWGGIVGDPSTLKTPAINEAFAPLYKIEKEAIEQHQEKLKEWEFEDKVSKLREDSVKAEIKNKMKKKSLSDEEALHLYSTQIKETLKPVCKRYKTNDSTIEKIHELLSQNPRGLIQHRDELVGLITGWEKDGHESDRGFYLESWNGYGSFTVDRVGRGTIYAHNICISIFGSSQPDKVLAYIQRSLHALENDGLLQRFQLLVYPDPRQDWEYVDQTPEEQAKTIFHNLAYQIARTEFFGEISDLQEVKGKKCLSFDDEAQETFIEWLTDFEKKLMEPDEPIIIQHLAKYRKLMPALALIFHVITIADEEHKTGKITKESVVRAINWCDYLESHARRIYGMALNISTQAASVLSKKIKRGELGQSFSVRDVYRKQWSFLKDRDSVEAACEELIKNHWLKEVSSAPVLGQKIKTEYFTNPKIGIAKKEEEEHE